MSPERPAFPLSRLSAGGRHRKTSGLNNLSPKEVSWMGRVLQWAWHLLLVLQCVGLPRRERAQLPLAFHVVQVRQHLAQRVHSIGRNSVPQGRSTRARAPGSFIRSTRSGRRGSVVTVQLTSGNLPGRKGDFKAAQDDAFRALVSQLAWAAFRNSRPFTRSFAPTFAQALSSHRIFQLSEQNSSTTYSHSRISSPTPAC